jgi:hypothetical protein
MNVPASDACAALEVAQHATTRLPIERVTRDSVQMVSALGELWPERVKMNNRGF